MRVVVLLSLGLPLLAPLAAAGTEDDPEIVDASGDEEPGTPGDDSADVLAAWLGPDVPPAGIPISFKVAQLGSVEGARYSLNWTQTNVFNPGVTLGYWSFEGSTDGAGTYGAVRGSYGPNASRDPGAQNVESQEAFGAERIQGAPGLVKAGLPMAFDGGDPDKGFADYFTPGDVFSDFELYSVVEGLVPILSVSDDAPPSNRSFQIPSSVGPEVFAAVAVPSRAPDMEDGETPSVDPRADVTGFWLDFTTENVTATLRIRDLTLRRDPACAWASSVELEQYRSTYARLTASFRFSGIDAFIVQTPTLSASNRTGPVPAHVSLQEGAPGYIQFVMPRDAWTGSSHISLLNVEAVASCGQSDSLRRYAEGGIPSASLALSVASIATLLLIRRRKL